MECFALNIVVFSTLFSTLLYVTFISLQMKFYQILFVAQPASVKKRNLGVLLGNSARNQMKPHRVLSSCLATLVTPSKLELMSVRN